MENGRNMEEEAENRNSRPESKASNSNGGYQSSASGSTVYAPRDPNVPVDDELELKKRGYFLGSTLGEGSYAKVKLAYSEALQRRIAIKIINKQKAKRDFVEKFLPREISIIRCVHHPNIVEIYDTIHIGYKIFVVMELAGHGDLLQYIKLKGALDERKARRMFSELTSGVAYLHGHGIVHRDLKCENLLLDVNNSIKISDFGFARLYAVDELSKTYCGSAAYAAPEILQGRPYVCPLYDIWSMGVILYIMVCGSMPFDDSNIKKMIKDQTERKIGFSRQKNLSVEVKELIYKLLESDISKRARIADIEESHWLSGHYVITEQGALEYNDPVVQKLAVHQHHKQQHQQGAKPVIGGVVKTAAGKKALEESEEDSSQNYRDGSVPEDEDETSQDNSGGLTEEDYQTAIVPAAERPRAGHKKKSKGNTMVDETAATTQKDIAVTSMLDHRSYQQEPPDDGGGHKHKYVRRIVENEIRSRTAD